MKNTIKAVLFDLDGTLIDTAPDIHYALNLVLSENGQADCELAQVKPAMSAGLHAVLKSVLKQASLPDLTHYNNAVLKYYPQIVGRFSHYFTGMEQVINTLEQHSIPWGIVTNKLENLAQMLLDAKQINTGVLVGGDSCKHNKPHPEPLLYACQKLSVNPKKCLYVGDDIKDMQAGRNAGLTTVAVSYGYGEVDETWEYDILINQPQELLQYL